MRSRIVDRRRGAVLLLVMVCLTALLSVVAIALDGGMLLSEKRHAQATADAAALAGASDLYKLVATNAGQDTGGTAKSSALAVAADNGYSNDGTTSTVDVRVPGDTYLGGPNVGQTIPAGYIEVTVTYHQRRYFSAVFGSGTIPIQARAVARGTWAAIPYGTLLLDPSGAGALTLSGNASLNTGSGAVMVNSSNTGAVSVSKNATLKGSELDINGGHTGSGTITTTPTANNINSGVSAVPDPLAYLPAPDAPANAAKLKSVKQTDSSVKSIITTLENNGTVTAAQMKNINNVYLVSPGRYTSSNKLSFSNKDMVIFKQASAGNDGIYYVDTGFSSNSAFLVMDPGTSGGMMIYNSSTASTDTVSIAGNSSSVVNLSGRAAGTYENMLIFQNRAATQTVSVTGNGTFTLTGTIYAPNALVSIAGNGALQTIGSQIIARTVSVSGNGTAQVNYSSSTVAHTRDVRLVE